MPWMPRTKLLYLKGTPARPLPQEAGWKDTVVVYPGQVTRFVVRWAPTDIPASTEPANASYPLTRTAGTVMSGTATSWIMRITR